MVKSDTLIASGDGFMPITKDCYEYGREVEKLEWDAQVQVRLLKKLEELFLGGMKQIYLNLEYIY